MVGWFIMKHNQGFSLIEAILALSIISLLTLGIIPQINQVLIKYKEKEQYLLMQQIL